MMTVFKFPVLLTDDYAIEMPRGATPLCVQMQHDAPQMWALCDPAQPMVTRRFRLAGTGHALVDATLAYIGTFQLRGGALVFHLFAYPEEDRHGK